jgi:hypothetical protein
VISGFINIYLAQERFNACTEVLVGCSNSSSPLAGDKNAAYEFAMITFINTHSKGLTILPTHRLVSNLEGFDFERFRKSVAPYFDWYSYPFADAEERAASYAEFRRDFEGSNHGRRGVGVYSGMANRGANAFYLFLLRRDVDLELLLPDLSESARAERGVAPSRDAGEGPGNYGGGGGG